MRGIMKTRKAFAIMAVVALSLLAPTGAFATTEVTGVVGALLGGDLNNIIRVENISIQRSFDNGPLYGARVGWVGGFLGVEGSFVGSPNGLTLTVPGQPIGINATVYYLEGNVLLFVIPGPFAPFVTAGAGLHSYDFDLQLGNVASADTKVQKLGFNFGGGLKINISRIVLRGEVRDHVTELGPEDFDLQEIADDLGFDVNQRFHNVEISLGLGFRF